MLEILKIVLIPKKNTMFIYINIIKRILKENDNLVVIIKTKILPFS